MLIFAGQNHDQMKTIWGSESLQMINDKQMHPQSVTIWCALWNGGMIGIFFFVNEASYCNTGEWRTLACYDDSVFCASIGRYCSRRKVVSAEVLLVTPPVKH